MTSAMPQTHNRVNALLEDLHRGALVVELAEAASVGVDLERAAAILLVVEHDDGGAGADANGGDLIVAAEVGEVGLGLVELPAGAAELAVLVATRGMRHEIELQVETHAWMRDQAIVETHRNSHQRREAHSNGVNCHDLHFERWKAVHNTRRAGASSYVQPNLAVGGTVTVGMRHLGGGKKHKVPAR